MGPISSSITLHQAGKACQGQTHQLTEPIRKLRKKWSVVNITRVVYLFLVRVRLIDIDNDNDNDKKNKLNSGIYVYWSWPCTW
jgi:hypothetical protein